MAERSAHVVCGHAVPLEVDGALGREDEVGVPDEHAADDKHDTRGQHEGQHRGEAVRGVDLVHALRVRERPPGPRHEAEAVTVDQHGRLQE